MLSHLRRLRRRRHRARHRAGRPRTPGPFHQLRPAGAPGPVAGKHRIPRSRSLDLSAFRPRALHAFALGKNAGSRAGRRARPAARALRHSPLRQRAAGARHGRAAPPAVHHHAARHGHHAGRQRPQLPAHHQVFHRAVRRRHHHLALPEEEDHRGIRHPAADRGHPQFRELRSVLPPRRPCAARRMGAERRAHRHAPLEFPSGEARHRRGRNLRADARRKSPPSWC